MVPPIPLPSPPLSLLGGSGIPHTHRCDHVVLRRVNPDRTVVYIARSAVVEYESREEQIRHDIIDTLDVFYIEVHVLYRQFPPGRLVREHLRARWIVHNKDEITMVFQEI
jgi:hypothetical protein